MNTSAKGDEYMNKHGVKRTKIYIIVLATILVVVLGILMGVKIARRKHFETLVDFVVEVEAGRQARVLQLTDTQNIDPEQERYPDRIPDDVEVCWKSPEDNYHRYLKQVVEESRPDLILITGDVIYGEFDDNGTVLQEFVAFMDSFKIPWAPVFGNHENESNMGADWQCKQFENSKYCLFKQRTLTGNGNYSVGIVQNNQLTRAFFMMDSNGCEVLSQASFENGHTQKYAGFGQDQIDWYTNEVSKIKEEYSNVKLSFCFHIPFAAFRDAYEPYPIPTDLDKADEEDSFGYLGESVGALWDEDKKVFNGMKELGADSILVGHVHRISASVMYEGIRMQHGQKSSTYDTTNYLTAEGEIVAAECDDGTNMPIVGGTLMLLDKETGDIDKAELVLYEEP